MITAYLALGGNLGDRKATLDAAALALAETPGVDLRAVSSYYETAPVGGPGGQGAFLNAAAAIETTLNPRRLVIALQTIEARAGRVRDVRWNERTLDLDLLLYGDQVVDEPGLTIPHPRMAVRLFVLTPLAEIAPDAVDPLTRRTAVELIAHLGRKPNFLCMIGMPKAVFRRVAEGLDAVGIDEPAGSDESYESETDLLVSSPDFFAILDRKTREFDQARRSTETRGDRWMLSDFWPDLLARDASHRLEGDERERWRELYRESRRRIVRPSFVVAQPYSYRQLRLWSDQNRDDPLGGSDVPLLCPGYADPFGFVKQSGLTERLDRPPDPALLDAMTAEILAACASSQGR